MSIVPMQFLYEYLGNFSSLVSIFHVDGTVAITHGGIEMGQGMNTKVHKILVNTILTIVIFLICGNIDYYACKFGM